MATYPSGVHSSGPAQYPYDDGTMIPFGPDGQKRLADRAALMAGAGIAYVANTAARDALVTNGDAFPGLHCYTYDTDVVWRYFASGVWLPAIGEQVGVLSSASTLVTGGTTTVVAGGYGSSHPAVIAVSGNSLVAVVAGLVRVTGNVGWGTNATGVRSMQVYKNGSALNYPYPIADIVPVGSTGLAPQSASGVVQAAAGDAFSLVLNQNSGATLSYSAGLSLEYVAAS